MDKVWFLASQGTSKVNLSSDKSELFQKQQDKTHFPCWLQWIQEWLTGWRNECYTNKECQIVLSRDQNDKNKLFCKGYVAQEWHRQHHPEKHTHKNTWSDTHTCAHVCIVTHLQTNTYFAVRRWCFLCDHGIEPNAVTHSGLIRTSRALERYKCAESNGTQRKLGLHWWSRATARMREGGIKTEKISGEREKANTKQSENRYSTFDKLFLSWCAAFLLYILHSFYKWKY